MNSGYGWQEVIQAFHLVVSALVFLSIIVPWLPVALGRTKLSSFVSLPFPFSIKVVASSPKPAVSSAESKPRAIETSVVTLTDVLNGSSRGASDEASHLRHALDVSAGLGGLIQVSFKRKYDQGPEFEQRRRAWIRLGELAVLDCKFFFQSFSLKACSNRLFFARHDLLFIPRADILVRVVVSLAVYGVQHLGPVDAGFNYLSTIAIECHGVMEPCKESAAIATLRKACVGKFYCGRGCGTASRSSRLRE